MSLVQVCGAAGLKQQATAVSGRRVLDLIVASAGLIVFCPIMTLVTLAIWIDGGRPIFFSQVRLGKGGRHFPMHKFRKFNRENGTAGPSVTMKNDGRLTRLGKLLERTKMDELPQLWNILKGDMSIVGPRPESLELADCFAGGYLRVLDHKPGVFGPNQVLFRNEGALYPRDSDPERFYRDVLFPLKAGIDVEYFSRRTILSDIEWVVRGVLAVFGWRILPAETFDGLSTGRLKGRELATAASVIRSSELRRHAL
jgi:lipopolysaccharide/colanic/teichoic acid biosynthesis glycosyltransferase